MFTKIMGDDQGDVVPAYIASEVDKRIDELEGALKSCAAVLVRNITSSEIAANQSRQALQEADRALALMVTGAGK